MFLVRTFFQKEASGSYYLLFLLFLLFLIYWHIMSPKPQLLLQEQQIRTVHVITACENGLLYIYIYKWLT